MESNVFNGSRFLRYFGSDLRSAISRFGISLLVFSTMAVSTDLFNGLFSYLLTGEWHGMIFPIRVLLFAIFAVIMLLSSPAKLYGYVTDHKQGTAFLMVPASRFEKYLSMVLISAVIVPLFFFSVYFTLDALVCLFDSTCGDSMFPVIFGAGSRIQEFINNLDDVDVRIIGGLNGEPVGLLNFGPFLRPWIYMDDLVQVVLFFLLGALIFKRGKTGKTIGCLILLSLSLQLILTPIFAVTLFDPIRDAIEIIEQNPENIDFVEALNINFPFYGWMLRHLPLMDTIQDTLVNGLLLFFIWLRLKRIKH